MAPNIHKGGETQQPNGDVSKRPNSAAKKSAPRSRAVAPASTRTSQRAAKPISNKAASIAGESPVNGVTSAYAIMASRIANRVAEMAESITFVERCVTRLEERPILIAFIDQSHKLSSRTTRREGRANLRCACQAPMMLNR